jgi:hypothetical protein
MGKSGSKTFFGQSVSVLHFQFSGPIPHERAVRNIGARDDQNYALGVGGGVLGTCPKPIGLCLKAGISNFHG